MNRIRSLARFSSHLPSRLMVYFMTVPFCFVPSKPSSQSFASPFGLPQNLQTKSIVVVPSIEKSPYPSLPHALAT